MMYRLNRSLLIGAAALAIGSAAGCVTDTDNVEGYADDTLAEPLAARVNTKKVVGVAIGASTTAGYTWIVGALNVPGQPFFAQNAHIAALEAAAESAIGCDLAVTNLAVGGKRSDEILDEQLPTALSLIKGNGKNALLSIEAGGNDLLQFLYGADAQDLCLSSEPADQAECATRVEATLDAVEANVRVMLEQTRAAKPKTNIIIQTQFNSLYGTRFDGQPCADAATRALGDAALEGNPSSPPGYPLNEGLNDRLRRLAAEFGADVNDIAGYLYSSGNFSDSSYFSSDCTHLSGVWEGIPGLTPGDSVGKGYETIFDTFVYGLLH